MRSEKIPVNAWIRIFIVSCPLFLFCASGHAEQYAWNFHDPRTALQWKAVDGSLERRASGSVVVRGNNTFWLVSPSNLNIPQKVSYVEFELKAPVTYVSGYIVVRSLDHRTWQKEFQLGTPGRFHIYRVNIREGNADNASIDSFAFAFGGLHEVELNYVRCYEPSFIDLVRIYWGDFWSASYPKASSVNFIETPPIGKISFPAMVYLSLALFALLMILVRKGTDKGALMRSLVISFIAAGMLFALRMDYAWYTTWRLDRASLSGKDLDERISYVEGTGAYDFAQSIKKAIPSGETVKIYAGALDGKLKYYLLPLMVSRWATYVVVFKDAAVSFDAAGNVLKKNNEIVANDVQLIRTFGKEGFLYRIPETSRK